MGIIKENTYPVDKFSYFKLAETLREKYSPVPVKTRSGSKKKKKHTSTDPPHSLLIKTYLLVLYLWKSFMADECLMEIVMELLFLKLSLGGNIAEMKL